jgi:hypothetical protein
MSGTPSTPHAINIEGGACCRCGMVISAATLKRALEYFSDHVWYAHPHEGRGIDLVLAQKTVPGRDGVAH